MQDDADLGVYLFSERSSIDPISRILAADAFRVNSTDSAFPDSEFPEFLAILISIAGGADSAEFSVLAESEEFSANILRFSAPPGFSDFSSSERSELPGRLYVKKIDRK